MTSEPLPKLTPSALSPCPDCGHACSKQAEHCPGCGRFFRRMGAPEVLKMSRAGWTLTITWGIVLAVLVIIIATIVLAFLLSAFNLASLRRG